MDEHSPKIVGHFIGAVGVRFLYKLRPSPSVKPKKFERGKVTSFSKASRKRFVKAWFDAGDFHLLHEKVFITVTFGRTPPSWDEQVEIFRAFSVWLQRHCGREVTGFWKREVHGKLRGGMCACHWHLYLGSFEPFDVRFRKKIRRKWLRLSGLNGSDRRQRYRRAVVIQDVVSERQGLYLGKLDSMDAEMMKQQGKGPSGRVWGIVNRKMMKEFERKPAFEWTGYEIDHAMRWMEIFRLYMGSVVLGPDAFVYKEVYRALCERRLKGPRKDFKMISMVKIVSAVPQFVEMQGGDKLVYQDCEWWFGGQMMPREIAKQYFVGMNCEPVAVGMYVVAGGLAPDAGVVRPSKKSGAHELVAVDAAIQVLTEMMKKGT